MDTELHPGKDPRYIPRRAVRMGNDRVNIRQPARVTTEDIDKAPMRYIALALTHLHSVMAKLPGMIEDHSKPVDEYRPVSLAADSTSGFAVQPQWEVGEIITSILVTGPISTGFQLVLGDRTLNLFTNAQGFCILAPISMILDRSDPRSISSATPGQWVFELMGHADSRTLLV